MVDRFLSDYIDGELSYREHLAISGHIAKCGRCREKEGELRQTIEVIRRDAVTIPSQDEFDDMWNRIVDRLGEVDAYTGIRLWARRLGNGLSSLLGSGFLWKLKYAFITAILIVASVLVDRAVIRPSIDEMLLSKIRDSLASIDEIPLIESPSKSQRPIITAYKTDLAPWREMVNKGYGGRQHVGLVINFDSVRIEDGMLTFVGGIDLAGLSEDELRDLIKTQGLTVPDVESPSTVSVPPQRVWLTGAPEPWRGGKVQESNLKSMVYSDTLLTKISIDDLN